MTKVSRTCALLNDLLKAEAGAHQMDPPGVPRSGHPHRRQVTRAFGNLRPEDIGLPRDKAFSSKKNQASLCLFPLPVREHARHLFFMILYRCRS